MSKVMKDACDIRMFGVIFVLAVFLSGAVTMGHQAPNTESTNKSGNVWLLILEPDPSTNAAPVNISDVARRSPGTRTRIRFIGPSNSVWAPIDYPVTMREIKGGERREIHDAAPKVCPAWDATRGRAMERRYDLIDFRYVPDFRINLE